MKQLSVIIVNYNVSHFLGLCLDSVIDATQHMDAEIIVVDNASSDASCDMVKEKFPQVQLIENKQNVGFATANNQGVAIANGEYICILNPDTVVGDRVFENVYAFAKSSSLDSQPSGEWSGKADLQLGAIGVRLVDGTGKFLPECKRNLPTPRVAFEKLFGNGDAYYAREVKSDQNGKIDILVGAFMFMRRAVYEEAGGFDEQYFMYGEDIDLSFTIKKMGYQNYYLGEEVVVHFKGESTAKDETYRKRFYNAMKIFYGKHLRRNAVEALIVRAGLWYARKFHRATTIAGGKNEKVALQNIYLVSTDESLEQTIAKSLKAKITRKGTLEASNQEESEYIWDMNSFSYQDCLRILIKERPKGVTFKFIPKNCTFALGSNSSEGRGMILEW